MQLYYDVMSQELITRETLELISQQQQTTQLIILLILVVSVGGTIAFFTLKGGLKVFDGLKEAINNLSNTEKETKQDIVDALEKWHRHDKERNIVTDQLFSDIKTNLNEINSKLDDLAELAKSNPKEHNRIINLLEKLNRTLERTKHDTDELTPPNEMHFPDEYK